MRKTLQLVKGEHKFIFRYDVGEEGVLLKYLVELVSRPDLPFDWFDAATLAHQIGQELKVKWTPKSVKN